MHYASRILTEPWVLAHNISMIRGILSWHFTLYLRSNQCVQAVAKIHPSKDSESSWQLPLVPLLNGKTPKAL